MSQNNLLKKKGDWRAVRLFTFGAEKATVLGDKMEKGRGLEKRNMEEKDRELYQRRNYEKRLTVLVEIEGEDRITMEILKKVRKECW